MDRSRSKSKPTKLMPSRLVDIARSKGMPRKRSWINMLPPEHREQLEELKEMYQSGELGSGWTPRALLVEVVKPAGIDIGVNGDTFRKWLTS